jgi:hypothetical protein
MFVSSFATIELVTFLSTFKEEYKTIPEALGYLKVEGVPIEEQEVRFKAHKLIVGLEWFEQSLFLTTLIAQCAMISELIDQVWAPITVPISKAFGFTFMKVIYAIHGTCVLLSQPFTVGQMAVFGSLVSLEQMALVLVAGQLRDGPDTL